MGDLSPVTKTDKGFVVLRLTQKRPGFSRPLPEVKRQIQQRLFRDLRSKAMDTFVDDLKKKSSITINDENLAKVVVESGTGRSPGWICRAPPSRRSARHRPERRRCARWGCNPLALRRLPTHP